MQALVVMLIGAFIVGGTGLGVWLRKHPVALVALCTLAAGSYYSLRVIE